MDPQYYLPAPAQQVLQAMPLVPTVSYPQSPIAIPHYALPQFGSYGLAVAVGGNHPQPLPDSAEALKFANEVLASPPSQDFDQPKQEECAPLKESDELNQGPAVKLAPHPDLDLTTADDLLLNTQGPSQKMEELLNPSLPLMPAEEPLPTATLTAINASEEKPAQDGGSGGHMAPQTRVPSPEPPKQPLPGGDEPVPVEAVEKEIAMDRSASLPPRNGSEQGLSDAAVEAKLVEPSPNDAALEGHPDAVSKGKEKDSPQEEVHKMSEVEKTKKEEETEEEENERGSQPTNESNLEDEEEEKEENGGGTSARKKLRGSSSVKPAGEPKSTRSTGRRSGKKKTAPAPPAPKKKATKARAPPAKKKQAKPTTKATASSSSACRTKAKAALPPPQKATGRRGTAAPPQGNGVTATKSTERSAPPAVSSRASKRNKTRSK